MYHSPGSLSRLAACLLLSFSGWVAAADLAVTPVPVTLCKEKPTEAITLRNNSGQPTVIQAQLLRWTQKAGEDLYAPSKELLVNPPIFTLQPGKSQVIRVGLNRAADQQQELAYRLYLEEVPPPPQPGFTGLQIALRLGLPIFVSPTIPYNKTLRWQAASAPADAIKVTLDNTGNAHVHVFEIKLAQPDNGKRILYTHQAHTYLLAGQSHSWLLQPRNGWKGNRVLLSARTDRGVVNAELPLEKE